MASPCEVLIDTDDAALADRVTLIAQAEAARIEERYSRYREDSIVSAINRANGAAIQVDEETAMLLDYAATCFELSEGRFDITSGALRRVWRFDGGAVVPSPTAIQAVLEHVGWPRARWASPTLELPAGMEIDLGGIGKEYAVDRAASLVAHECEAAFLVNFGGDLFARGPRRGDRPWIVGVDDPTRTGEAALLAIELTAGGLATSGDARRFVLWEGRRLGHILDPRTGWPIEGGPRSVTVVARSCLEAGTLATLAYLRGGGAGDFLREEGVEHWIF